MAELNTDDGGGSKGGKHQKKRAKKSSTKIDMTPMVDLAFLLLTFFMLTTTFSKPKTMEINMPAKPNPDDPIVKVPNALTVLLSGDNKIYYYYGELKVNETRLKKTDYSKDGIRKILLDKNKWTVDQLKQAEESIKAQNIKEKSIADSLYKAKRSEVFKNKQSLTVLLKADEKAKYKNVVDVLDELQITDVGKFAIVDVDSIEVLMIKAM
jgi:biopolymer transport protein ExbD